MKHKWKYVSSDAAWFLGWRKFTWLPKREYMEWLVDKETYEEQLQPWKWCCKRYRWLFWTFDLLYKGVKE